MNQNNYIVVGQSDLSYLYLMVFVCFFIANTSMGMACCQQSTNDVKTKIEKLNVGDFESRQKTAESILGLRPIPVSAILETIIDNNIDSETRSKCVSMLQDWSLVREYDVQESMHRAFLNIESAAFGVANDSIGGIRERVILELRCKRLIRRLDASIKRNGRLLDLELIREIREIGIEAREATRVLVDLLTQEISPDVMLALISIEQPSEIAPLLLKKLVTCGETELTDNFFQLAGFVANDSKELAAVLGELAISNGQNRRLAVFALKETHQFKFIIEVLNELLEDDNEQLVEDALAAIRQHQHSKEKSMSALIELASSHDNRYLRGRALLVISELQGELDDEITALFRRALKDKNEFGTFMREGAIVDIALQCLVGRQDLAKKCADELNSLLNESDLRNNIQRYRLVTSLLGDIDHRESLKILENDLELFGGSSARHNAATIRINAASAILQMDPTHTVARRELLGLLKELKFELLNELPLSLERQKTCSIALHSIGKMGEEAGFALRTLVDLLDLDIPDALKTDIIVAVGRITPSMLRSPLIVTYFEESDTSSLLDAIFCCCKPDEAARILVNGPEYFLSSLGDAIYDRDSEREYWIKVLAGIDEKWQTKFSERLIKCLENGVWTSGTITTDEFSDPRMTASEILSVWLRVSKSKPMAIAELSKLLTMAHHTTRSEAARLLGTIAEPENANSILPKLANRLTDYRAVVRGRAAEAVGNLGVVDSEAMTKLELIATQDDYAFVREMAVKSLVKLRQVNQ